jgi:hypothetical protein
LRELCGFGINTIFIIKDIMEELKRCCPSCDSEILYKSKLGYESALKKESISDQNTIKSPKFTHEETCRIVDLDARDFACLYLKVPESSHEWLNDLITKHRKENLL